MQLFKFTASRSFQFVAPGLSVSGLLEFTPEKNEEVRDCLPIHVDDTETIEVPLLGWAGHKWYILNITYPLKWTTLWLMYL